MFHSIFNSYLFSAVAAFLLSFLLTFLLTPLLRKTSIRYGFYAEPNHRSSHSRKIPNTGGILLFFAMAISVFCFVNIHSIHNLVLLSISFLVLYIVGVLDDLFNVSVKFKLIGQFLPAVLILLSLKTQDLVLPFIAQSVDYPLIVKFAFWLFVVVAIINAYNFIDGIDGLAIGMGSFGGLLFGIYFLANGYINLSLVGFTLAGGLLGLLKHNLSHKKKIFIGDTGSLIIGGAVSLLILRHLEVNLENNLNFSSSMAFGILFIPASDLVRVVISRLVARKSPFNADRTHVHHIVMSRFKLSHRRTTVYVMLAQCLVFFIFLGYNEFFEKGQILFSIAMFLVYVVLLEGMRKKRLTTPLTAV